MTAQATLDDWATRPSGKAARVTIAIGGMVTATLVLIMSTVLNDHAWSFLLLGVALAATSVRAARVPTIGRLTAVAINLLAIPLLVPLF